MQSGLYNKHLPELVRSGKVPMAVVDRAVRRVLHVKKALGLFDNPYRSLDFDREKKRYAHAGDGGLGARGRPQVDRHAEE